MKKLIDYPTRPGAHCGSTAMRSLLAFHCGLDLSEAMVAGLGAVADCLVIEQPLGGLPFSCFGRGLTMEMDAGRALGVGYVETPDFDDARAWEAVRQEIIEGRPTMLSGDTYYLGYHPSTSHFPSHRFVLVGFDDEARVAWIVDRPWVEPQACPYDELSASRNPPDWPVSTYNLWGRFRDTTPRWGLGEACRRAIKKAADRFLGRDRSQQTLVRAVMRGDATVTSGLEGVSRLRELLGETLETPVGPSLAKALADTFELRGTGGGNFRRLYATFVEEAGELVAVHPEAAPAAWRAAEAWTALAAALMEVHAGRGGTLGVDAAMVEILAAETALAEALDASCG